MATYKILYNQKDITADVSPYLQSMTYTDNTEGESDQLEFVLDDTDGLWSDAWYPQYGAEMQAKIINDDGSVLDCGTFELDEVRGSGSKSSGTVVTIKALGAGIKQTVRTRKSYAHENKTLREIAQTIATKYNYTIVGDIPNVQIIRETQWRETPLAFLSRLAAEYGIVFSIRNRQMIFTSIFDLEGAQSVLSLMKSDVKSFEVVDKTADTYLMANSTYHSPHKKKVISGSTRASQLKSSHSTKYDYIEIRTRAETPQQAELKSKAALYQANSLQRSANFSLPGNALLVAGVNIELKYDEWKLWCGIYHIIKSTHTVDKSGGYAVDLETKGVGLLEKEKREKAQENL